MNEKFMKIALAESETVNCAKGKVGAVIVLNEKVLGKGNNFVPKGYVSCTFEKYRIKQDKLYKSDFDNFLNKVRMIV